MTQPTAQLDKLQIPASIETGEKKKQLIGTITASGPFETNGGGYVMLTTDFTLREDLTRYGISLANSYTQVLRTIPLDNDGLEIHFKFGTTPDQMALTSNVIRAHWANWIKNHQEEPVQQTPRRIIQKRRAPINTPYGKF